MSPDPNGTVLRAVFVKFGHEKPGGMSELECENNNTIPTGNFAKTWRKSEAPST
jgi:hypothetical protein